MCGPKGSSTGGYDPELCQGPPSRPSLFRSASGRVTLERDSFESRGRPRNGALPNRMESPSTDVDQDHELVLFSVIIGTYNGAAKLGVALDALAKQSLSDPFEVIVVNDASTDETSRVATRDSVRLINLTTNRGHGHTLNVGLENARGRYIALMDDDCVPPPEWLELLARSWKSVDESVTMIGGPVLPASEDSFNRRYVAYRRPLRPEESELSDTASLRTRFRHAFFPRHVADTPRAIYYAVGANMSVRTSAAREVGGFTERRGAGEEVSIARPLRRCYGDQTVRYFPDVVMRHDFAAGVRDSIHRARMYGRAHGRDWVHDGGSPTFRPIPAASALLVIGAASVGAVGAALAILVAPLVMYRRWVPYLRERRSLEVITYPYVEAVEELADNLGFLEGSGRALLSRLRREVPRG